MTPPIIWTALPDTVWFTTGLGVLDDPATTIEDRLREQLGGDTEAWARHDLEHGKKTVFDVLWTPQPGALVRARLQLSDDGPAFRWGIIAESNAPWDWTFPSPATLFFPRAHGCAWDGVAIERLINAKLRQPYRYRAANLLRTPGFARAVVKAAAESATEFHVLTTDSDPPAPPVVPLVRFLPPGFTGRVIEHRVLPAAVAAVNAELRDHGLSLPEGGALVLPQRLRHDEDVPSLTVSHLRWSAGRPQELVAAVLGLSSRPLLAPPFVHRSLAELRRTFSVATDQEAIAELEVELQETRQRATAAAARLEELQEEATRSQTAARTAQVRIEELGEQLSSLDEELSRVRAEADRLRAEAATSVLGRSLRAERARADAAEQDLDAAEDLLEEQAREIAWLRERLRSADAPPANAGVPALLEVPRTWEELKDRAGLELEHVVLGDVVATARSLRGHPLEDRWRARAWQALLVLNAYARAAEEHGPVLLPHLSAYLEWREASAVLPRTWYVPSESQAVMNTPRLRSERVFAVPREVDPSGRVIMGEHIRIGSGRPPAPRMHLHDAVPRTGRVYVGYVGEHLRTAQTN